MDTEHGDSQESKDLEDGGAEVKHDVVLQYPAARSEVRARFQEPGV